MEPLVLSIEGLGGHHGRCASLLAESCAGEFFPCDVLAISILNRSLELSAGFCLVARAMLYSPGVCLLRVQLDSVLRFHGVANTPEPHETANCVLNGIKLSSLKDAAGQKMSDSG